MESKTNSLEINSLYKKSNRNRQKRIGTTLNIVIIYTVNIQAHSRWARPSKSTNHSPRHFLNTTIQRGDHLKIPFGNIPLINYDKLIPLILTYTIHNMFPYLFSLFNSVKTMEVATTDTTTKLKTVGIHTTSLLKTENCGNLMELILNEIEWNWYMTYCWYDFFRRCFFRGCMWHAAKVPRQGTGIQRSELPVSGTTWQGAQ